MDHQPVTAEGEGGPVPRELSADDLTMTPPTPDDVALVAELLDLPADHERPAEVVQDWIAHWEERGWGTWVVRQGDGLAVGFVGLQDHGDFVRLTTRSAAGTAAGRMARALRLAMGHALAWLPDLPVRMRVAPEDSASRELLTAAGLVHAPDQDHEVDGETWQVLELPYIRVVDRVPPRAAEAVLDMWVRVNDSGGAVGFRPGTSRGRVSAVLDDYADRMVAGRVVGVSLNSPEGELLGLGFLVPGTGELQGHTASIERVMTDPDRRGLGYGRLLMAGLHRAARERGIERTVLDQRDGTGVGEFYARFGYEEVGRVPGALRVAEGDDRDRVIMSRAL